MTIETTVGKWDEGVRVVYDFEARLLGQRYLCCVKYGEDDETVPGYVCIPVAD